MDKLDIAKRLKQIRGEKGKTQQEVAEYVGVSDRSVIANWEKGKTKPKEKYLQKYANYFDVSVDWIKYGELDEFVKKVIWKNVDGDEIYDVDYLSPLPKAVYDYSMGSIDIDIEEEVYELKDEEDYYYGKIDVGALTEDVIDDVLFGYSRVGDGVSLRTEDYYEAYRIFYEEIGYNEDALLRETIKLFKTNLRDLKKINNYLDDEINLKEEAEKYNLSELLPYIKPSKPKILEEYKTHPNITNLINKLEIMRQNNSEDINDAIYQAIDKLLD